MARCHGYANQGYRHGLRLENVHGARISCLTISDTGGDGVYIAGTSGKGVAPTPGSSNVVLSRLTLLRNQRQGMSVIAALNLLVEDTLFAHTNGSEPMAGVDLEPNTPQTPSTTSLFAGALQRRMAAEDFRCTSSGQ